MSPLKPDGSRPAFWRSMDQLAGSPEFRRFVEREFPAWADELTTAPSRRDFLKVMGASLALAGMTGCRWPKEEIVPFSSRPEGFTPGVPQHFATAMDLDGAATGLLVTSYDGRPIKIEGNPDHWQSRGGTLAWHQASILDLYDPERSQSPHERDFGARTWDEFVAFVAERSSAWQTGRGAGLCVLAEPHSSPSRAVQRDRLLAAFPRAKWYEYSPVSRDNAREGAKLALGGAFRTQVSFDRARAIVALDEDFLLHHPAAVRYARDFVAGRDPHGSFSRLWMVESGFSLTGSLADRRIALSPRRVSDFALCLAAELFLERGVELPRGAVDLAPALDRVRRTPVWTDMDRSAAADLLRERGRSVVLAGPRQPPEIHALVHVINAALGSVGSTVRYTAEPDADRPAHVDAIRRLAAEAADGQVDTLVILGGNPLYDAPADVGFADALAGVRHSVHLSSHRNETSAACSWHLPRAHYLETWGDARDWRGAVTISQPLILPLYDGRSDSELVSLLITGAFENGHEIVRRTFFDAAGRSGSEAAWQAALHDGFVAGTEWPDAAPAPRTAAWADRLQASTGSEDGAIDLVFVPDSKLIDGRFANNGWLQELPDPLTKLTWSNAALLAPATAAELGVGQADRVRISTDRATAELPVFILPGMAQRTVAVALGYGRTAAGVVGDGRGADCYPLRTSDAMGWVGVSIEPAGGRATLATTQDHFAIDEEGAREIAARAPLLVREMELDEFHAHPAQGAHEGEGHAAVDLWDRHEYPDNHKWGMAIDLNACVGCNACVVACQAENNIPVVGHDEVARGREMHWIRVDRYFSGEPDHPSVSFQPVTCQHCATAPCEQVCPVGATVHDHQGLNVMVYNRCVGTRYCANNCPYKVRRFNYFNNNKRPEAPLTMIYNPEVTLRARGVMEKCTFCIQRIEAVKIAAKNDRRPIRDGEVVPACAQACPTRAIHFGDLHDEASHVAQLHHDPRAYALLEELNVRPANRYLVRLRNRGVEPGADGPSLPEVPS